MSDARRTGRTQRNVVAACMAMMLGKRVVYVTHSGEHAKYCRDLATTWLEENVVPHIAEAEAAAPGRTFPTIVSLRTKISFGSGSVEFTAGGNFAGQKISKIYEDHHFADLRIEREAKERRRAAGQQIIALMREHGFSHATQLGRAMTRDTSIEFT